MATPPKNIERDLQAGRALAAWMKVNGYTDKKLGQEASMSEPTVATWRKGTRPTGRAREWLADRVGWEWDDPPGADYAPHPSVMMTTPARQNREFIPTPPSADPEELTRLRAAREALLPIRNLDGIEDTIRDIDIRIHEATIRAVVAVIKMDPYLLHRLREQAVFDTPFLDEVARRLGL